MSDNQYDQDQNPRYSVSVEPNRQNDYHVHDYPDPKEDEFRAKVKALIDSREDLKFQQKLLSEKIESLVVENSALKAELEKYRDMLAESKDVIDDMRRQAVGGFGWFSPMYARPQQCPYAQQGRSDGGVDDLCGHMNKVLADMRQRICALERGRN